MVRKPDYTGRVEATRNAGIDAGGSAGETAGHAPDELVVLLIRTAKAVVDGLRSEHPEKNSTSMTPVHGLAARYLVGRTDVTTVELARHLAITKQSASEVVAVLEATGTVRRAPHPTDGRARVILLTEEGEARLRLGRARWQRVEDDWVDIVGRDRIDALRSVLEDILAADAVGRDGRIPADQNSSCVAS
jgi:DNA-binding MarR family transcriptional regulator